MTGVLNLGEMCRTPRAIDYYPGRFLRRRRRRRLRRTLVEQDRMNLSKQYTKYLKLATAWLLFGYYLHKDASL